MKSEQELVTEMMDLVEATNDLLERKIPPVFNLPDLVKNLTEVGRQVEVNHEFTKADWQLPFRVRNLLVALRQDELKSRLVKIAERIKSGRDKNEEDDY